MKKKIVFLTIGILIIIILIMFMLSDQNSEVIKSIKVNDKNNYDIISLMLETDAGTGEYVVSKENIWPKSGYVYNKSLSKCENGGTIEYNKEKQKVIIKNNKSDKCYIFFDVVPTDATINISNIDHASSLNANLECKNGLADYNQKFGQIEISSINKNIICNLNYNEIENKDYLNNKIISLNNTTQGDGIVANEVVTEPDYSVLKELTQSDYGTTKQFQSTNTVQINGTALSNTFTFENGQWITNSSTMNTGNYYYNLSFSLSGGGYYQFCYEMSAGSSKIVLFRGGTSLTGFISSSTVKEINNCINLDYVSSGGTYRFIQQNPNSNSGKSTVKFSIKKVDKVITADTGYRYQGKNPNNYVWFNNELWRIIGVFGRDSHGIVDAEGNSVNLVKIIREKSIGSVSYDIKKTGSWSTSSLKQLLNDHYLNSKNATGNDNCYFRDGVVKSKCNYSITGIKKNKDMIKTANWHIPNISGSNISSGMLYIYEKEYDFDSDKIGLMYLSDYGLASPKNKCSRTSYSNSYDDNCILNNWLYGQGYEYTISGVIGYGGGIDSNPYYGLAVRPVLYLESGVFVLKGSGSINDPYIIGM